MESTPLLRTSAAENREDEKKKRSRIFVIAIVVVSFVLVLIIGLIKLYHDRNPSDDLVRKIPFKTVSHPMAPTALWGKVVKPYPTGAFWTNLAVDKGLSPIGQLPYGIKCNVTGVQVSYGAFRRYTTQISIWDDYVPDLLLTANESYVSRSIESYDFASVTMGFVTTSGSYKAPIVKGCPFVTVVYYKSTPVIDASVMKFYSIEKKTMKGSSGTQYLVILWNWQKWLVYCSEDVELIQDGDRLVAASPISGFIRVALIPPGQDASYTFALLMTYVSRYPTGAKLSYHFPNDKTAILTYEYTSSGGSSPLLMLSLPHHAELLAYPVSDNATTTIQTALKSLYSMKGRMKAIVGDTWRLKYTLPKVGFTYDTSGHEGATNDQQTEVISSLKEDIKTVPTAFSDPYQYGKEVARMARLAIIADEFGQDEEKKAAVLSIEKSLVVWLEAMNGNTLVYDKVYGGIIPISGFGDKYADYGSTYYSDHHFHYGYFIYAFAVISKLDPKYADKFRPAFDTIVRDICTIDPADAEFPFVRHKDFFDGHSWASGLYNQQNGKGQESSSEAVNAYYALYLYATQTGKTELSSVTHLLLAMEIQAAKWYWQMKSGTEVYDAIFASRKIVGNVGALDATTTTWFGFELEFVHGINIMPITPATALLLEADFVTEQWPVLGDVLPTPEEEAKSLEKLSCSVNKACALIGLGGDCCPAPSGVYLGCCDPRPGGERPMQNDWRSLLYADLAIINKDEAWDKLFSMKGYGSGGSRANYLLWAATRPPASVLSVETHAVNYTQTIPVDCSASANCDALGLSGLCCPAGNGVSLGCCPKAVDIIISENQ